MIWSYNYYTKWEKGRQQFFFIWYIFNFKRIQARRSQLFLWRFNQGNLHKFYGNKKKP